MKRQLIGLMLMLAWPAWAQLTATVQPGYQFGAGETPTTATLNLLGLPTVTVSGTISGTVGLADNSVNGNQLVTGLPDNITLDWNASNPRQLEIKNQGVGPNQVATSVAGAGLSGGGGSALAVQVDGTSISINASNQLQVVGIVGQVVAYAGASAPTGWLECNGDDVSSVTYSNLWLVLGTHWGSGSVSTTTHLPDLRGQFIRGWDHGRNVDLGDAGTGRTQYSSETNMVQSHLHYLVANADGSANPGTTLTANNQIARANTAGASDNSDYLMAGTSTAATLGLSSGPVNSAARETRPVNMALIYIIKW